MGRLKNYLLTTACLVIFVATLTLLSLLVVPPPIEAAAPIEVLTIQQFEGAQRMAPELEALLVAQGFVFRDDLLFSEPITPAALIGVGVLFFTDRSTVDDTMSPSERDALVNFVESGGGIIVAGEVGGFGPANLASVGAPFGIGSAGGSFFETATDFTPHPVTANLSALVIFGGIALSVTDPATAIGRLGNGQPFLAVAQLGQGRVVVVGDEVWLSRDFGNPTFVSNVFNWVSPAMPVCSSIVTTIDGLKAKVNALDTNARIISTLNATLDNVQAALDTGNNKTARSHIKDFIDKLVRKSNKNRIVLDDANNLICDAANVLLGIPLP